MLQNQEIVQVLIELGQKLKQKLNESDFDSVINAVKSENAWFIEKNVRKCLANISEGFLDKSTLDNFLKNYAVNKNLSPSKIGMILAGNIPAVGFQDLIYVLLSGNIALLKLSASDKVLMNFLINEMLGINPEIKNHIKIVERLNDAEAFIATGSDNSARYFDYYFKNKPSIIRKNRSSVAVLDNETTKDQLFSLGNDIFDYFGLGCRNVSKLYVPEAYDFNNFFEAIEPFGEVFMHHKYKNNYDYNYSVLLLNQANFLNNGFVNLLKSDQLVSPISVIHYETYQDITDLNSKLESQSDKIQCIVSQSLGINKKVLDFGESQKPTLFDFADDVDVMKFLSF